MFELKVKNLDREVLSVHSEVTFHVRKIEDDDTIRDFIEARLVRNSTFIAGLMLSKPVMREGLRFTESGFETSGVIADVDGFRLAELAEDPWRLWEVVYVEE
jgi:hypothetical protein